MGKEEKWITPKHQTIRTHPAPRNKDPKMPGKWGKCWRNTPSGRGAGWCQLSLWGKRSFHRGGPAVGENLLVLWHQPPLHISHSGWRSWARASWCALSCWLVSLRLGVGAWWPIPASPASLFSYQQLFSSPQGNWKIPTADPPRHRREITSLRCSSPHGWDYLRKWRHCPGDADQVSQQSEDISVAAELCLGPTLPRLRQEASQIHWII